LAHVSIAPYGQFACEDGAIVMSIQNEREWASFCEKILAQPSLARDPRFDTNLARVENRAELDACINSAFARKTRAVLAAALDNAGIAFGLISDVADLAHHPHLRRRMTQVLDSPIDIPVPPGASTDWRPGQVPALGQHSQAIRREFCTDTGPKHVISD
jgi:crotonobetainyl-CoA:carnitine CoA-transferase CaiB-like acyl-CoA transferase